MEKPIEWYQGMIEELRQEFSAVHNLFDKIDEMVRPEWSLPEEFTSVIRDVMAVVDTAPSDAINSGAIALSGASPIFSVSPFVANMAEYDRAQGLEDNLTYHFEKMNARGNGSLMYDMADSSLRYNTICVRVDDLAHIFPKDRGKWTPLQKRAWSYGRFLGQCYHPKTVFYLESSYGITTIAHEQSYKVMDLINHWSLYENNKTEEGQRVASALRALRADVESITSQRRYPMKNINVVQTYVINDDEILTWASLTDAEGEAFRNTDDYTFVKQPNKYGFLNWSIRVAGSRIEEAKEYRVNPLLAPLYWSQSWDKLNLAKSIIFSEPIRRARNPRGIAITQSGDPPVIDYENGNEINLRTGEDYKPFQALTMDENALAVVNALESAMNRTTGASVIGDTTKISSNTPFSTFSAMVKVALSRLDKQRDILGLSSADVACYFAWWAEKTQMPLKSFSRGEKQYRSGKMLHMGDSIETTPDDYDLDELGISAKVVPMTPTDEMEQINIAIQLSQKLNVPVSKALERLGYENVGLMYDLWAREFLRNAELQAQAAAMTTEATETARMNVQNQMMQQQQQAAGGGGGAPQGEGPGMMGAGGDVATQAFGAMSGAGEGFDPGAGGGTPMQGAPGMTREAITGQTMMEGM